MLCEAFEIVFGKRLLKPYNPKAVQFLGGLESSGIGPCYSGLRARDGRRLVCVHHYLNFATYRLTDLFNLAYVLGHGVRVYSEFEGCEAFLFNPQCVPRSLAVLQSQSCLL